MKRGKAKKPGEDVLSSGFTLWVAEGALDLRALGDSVRCAQSNHSLEVRDLGN